jgi:hypothetical protein
VIVQKRKNLRIMTVTRRDLKSQYIAVPFAGNAGCIRKYFLVFAFMK